MRNIYYYYFVWFVSTIFFTATTYNWYFPSYSSGRRGQIYGLKLLFLPEVAPGSMTSGDLSVFVSIADIITFFTNTIRSHLDTHWALSVMNICANYMKFNTFWYTYRCIAICALARRPSVTSSFVCIYCYHNLICIFRIFWRAVAVFMINCHGQEPMIPIEQYITCRK